MTMADSFDEHRPLLFSIAYRMLGTRADAEDAVQETFLRWQAASAEEIKSPRAYLATVVTRICLDHFKSARTRREVYVGPWLPEPVPGAGLSEPANNVELAESLTMAFLVVLESLSPSERAAFLLHEVFDYDYTETAEMIGKSEANCRQMVHRAKEHIASRHRRFDPTREESQRVTARFLEAAGTGDVTGLMSILAEDAVMTSDGGGKVRAALNPVHGADAIARFVIGVVRKNMPPQTIHKATEFNRQPAFVSYVDGHPIAVSILDVRDGLVRNLYIVANPDKLQKI